ncbi:DUF4395 domain-containing protein [Paenibacillus durus]|uniref:DUF4395 domain-containing protein n=1 Tax=Paenibacillus durus ATCC 35681 TaxID=1333534 RepID=A0A0F7CIU4_PAEDU|nr:DUF4395 domain-containing protein [Paenibacillus durus]AKG34940.1 hypothetical protein VK70_10500 [Paenibacillus durus ATCC 35681]
MADTLKGIPRPLVRVNQSVIVLSVLLTWLTGFYWFLAIPLAAGLLGLIFHFNPVIRLSARFLRKDRSAYILEDEDQQSFNQTIAVLCLAAGLISYLGGYLISAYIFTAIVAAAAFVAILGFCIGCFIHYQWKMYTYRRKQGSPR